MEDEFLNDNLIDRFEQMLEKKEHYFFETDEFYEIIAYYIDVGDLPYAKKAIDYALEMYPLSIDIQIKKLEYLLAINRLKEASQLVLELKDAAADDLDYLIAVGRYWSLKENPKIAISFFEKALDLEEDMEYIFNCIGTEYLALNEPENALINFRKALDLDPDDEFAFFSCLNCYDELNRSNDCIEFLNNYIDERPYSDTAWSQLGEEYMLKKDYENAHKAFDYATIINPRGIMAFTQKAACLEKLEDYEAAIEVYMETLSIDDSAAFTYMKIGNCFVKLGKPFKALKSYHQSLHEDPQLAEAWMMTSDLYESLGNYDESLFYLNRAAELDSMNPDLWKRRAYLHIQLSKLEESSLDYYKLVELEPKNFYNWLGLVEVLITIGEYQKAIEAIFKAQKHFNRAELYYQLSNCYYLSGEEQLGKGMFLKALEMNASLQLEMFKKYPILENRFKISNKKPLGKRSK